MALLDDVKLHLRVSGTDSDALLTRLINSAVREFVNFLCRHDAFGGDAGEVDELAHC